MALCTLHPSLSALVANLEAQDQLRLAIGDSPTSGELIRPSEGSSTIFGTLQGGVQQDMGVVNCLRVLAAEDSVYSLEHFLPSASGAALASLLSVAQESEAKILSLEPKSISEVLSIWDDLGKATKKVQRARDLHQRVEAQILDWTSNFYARLRGKRVLVLTSLNPVVVASSWIADVVRKIGAIAPELDAESDQIVVDWKYVARFDPHVLILAPVGKTLAESCGQFFELEKLQGEDLRAYEATPAAKRGDVYFSEGLSSFYCIDYRILKTVGIIVSATAGFESGYITDRDSFHKLRYLEMHRHKI